MRYRNNVSLSFIFSFFFSFIFSFSFVFYIIHCPKKKNINRAQWRASLSAHHQPSSFPLPTTALPLPLPLLLRLLYYPLSEEEEHKQSTVERSSLSSPSASVVSTASHCSSSSPSPSHSPSPSPLFMLLSTVLQREQWRVIGLWLFHRPSVHHCHAALPLLFLLHLGYSLLFWKWTVESIFTVHGQTGSGPNLNARCLGLTQQNKKNPK